MNLYTVVLDYHGGAYISQFDADSETQAAAAWCDELHENQLLGEASDRVADGLKADVVGHHLVAVEGLSGAWCAAALVDDNLALLNVIVTQKPS